MKGKDSSLLRVTGLFPTKRKGMYTGSLRPEDAKKLADLLEQTDRVSIFVFRNDRDRDSGAEFVMYAAPDTRPPLPAKTRTERQPIGRGARRAEPEPEPERDDDLPF